MSDYNLYFIAIVPDDQVFNEVMEFKLQVAEKFNSRGALNSPPHITLHMPFKWAKDREQLLLDKLGDFRYQNGAFKIHLEGFDYFEPRVVFVNIAKNESLRSLFTKLSGYTRRELKLFNADYKSRGFHPHMTIGFRDLKKSAFYQAKEYFETQSYINTFEVKGIWLLKHNGQQWDQFKFYRI